MFFVLILNFIIYYIISKEEINNNIPLFKNSSNLRKIAKKNSLLKFTSI